MKGKGVSKECVREMYKLSQEPGNESLSPQELYNKVKKAKE